MGGIPNHLYQFVTELFVYVLIKCVFIQYFPQHSVGKIKVTRIRIDGKEYISQYMIVTNVLVHLI